MSKLGIPVTLTSAVNKPVVETSDIHDVSLNKNQNTINEDTGRAIGDINSLIVGEDNLVGAVNANANAIVNLDDTKANKVDVQTALYLKADKTAITNLQNTKAAKTTVPNDITRTQTDAIFIHDENGTSTNLFNLRQATSQLAGLLSATMYNKLNNLPSKDQIPVFGVPASDGIDFVNNDGVTLFKIPIINSDVPHGLIDVATWSSIIDVINTLPNLVTKLNKLVDLTKTIKISDGKIPPAYKGNFSTDKFTYTQKGVVLSFPNTSVFKLDQATTNYGKVLVATLYQEITQTTPNYLTITAPNGYKISSVALAMRTFSDSYPIGVAFDTSPTQVYATSETPLYKSFQTPQSSCTLTVVGTDTTGITAYKWLCFTMFEVELVLDV